MAQQILASTRRDFLGGAMGGIALGLAPGLIGSARAADDFKIGLFYAQSGPASLFGPTQLASAQLAVEEVNKAGGIMGRADQAVSDRCRRPSRRYYQIGGPPVARGQGRFADRLAR